MKDQKEPEKNLEKEQPKSKISPETVKEVFKKEERKPGRKMTADAWGNNPKK